VTRDALTRSVWLVAALVVAFHLATAQIYSYHRDEFYYLASGRRLAWGYVDHPPLTPFLYRVSDTLFGSSLFGLRVVPAFLHGGLVLLTALLARELGGDARAQIAAAIAAAVAPMLLTLGHFLSTVTPEVLIWCAITLFVIRLLNGGDPRLWLVVGALVGVGFLDKWTTEFLVLGLAVGLLLVPERTVLRTPWLLAGIAVALVIWAPNLWWQARHRWPQFEVAKGLRNPGEAWFTAPGVIILSGAAIILAIPGLLWLIRSPDASHYRALAIAFGVIVVAVTVTQGKPYYAGSFTPVLFAAGATAAVTTSTAWLTAMAVWGVLSAPLAMPLLPLATAESIRHVNKEVTEMVGWPQLVDTVDQVYEQHPDATILASNYSEAGVIELLGHEKGLPQPISGHMTYWYWGHPSGKSDETIVIGSTEARLRQWFGDVQLATTFHSPQGIHNEEDATPIWVCRDQLVDWDTIWPEVRHF
jgi:4-amino-4-deoxy-L-arabinose transferase-like glycosyltransferase